MLAWPTVFISHSEKFKDRVAVPFGNYVESLGMNAILVSEMPTPEHGGAEPDAKVDYYLNRANMFVALMTPDDRTDSGEVHARPNVTDEISRARTRPHLRDRVQVFKAAEVDLHSNIDPTYEPLDPEDVAASFPVFERQAIAWELIEPEPPPTPGPMSAVGPIGPSEGGGGDSAAASRGARGQAAAAVAELRTALLAPEAESAEAPLPRAAARAHLAASVALAAVRSTSPFGVHELNGLYRERETLRLTAEEERYLLRAILLHQVDENAPGWYWFRTLSAANLHQMLVDIAREDPDIGVRVRALNLLADTHTRVPRSELRAVIEAGLGKGEEAAVRAAALKLLASRGDTRLLGELGAALDVAGGAEAILAVRARYTPVAALRELHAHPAGHSEEVEARILTAARKLPAGLLRAGLDGDDARIRLLSLRALERSSRLRKADALAFIAADIPSGERHEALRLALRRGWALEPSVLEQAIRDPGLPFGEENELRIAFYSRWPAEQLLAGLEWIGDNSWTWYTALGQAHFDLVAERIRADLDADFKSLRDAYREKIERIFQHDIERKMNELPPERRQSAGAVTAVVSAELDKFFSRYESLEAFTVRRFQVAALRALVAHGDADDVRFARRLIDSEDGEITNLCVALLARFGSADDVDLLLTTSERLYREDAQHAASAALAVSDNVPVTVDRLIETGKPAMVRLAVAALDESPLELATERLLPLLGSKDESVRCAAVDHLAVRLDTPRQRALIDAYITSGDYYFYNVIVRLDRRLYAPGWLRSALVEGDRGSSGL